MSSELDVDGIERAAAERREEWLDVLSGLIRVPSENPPGDTTGIADHFTELLDDRGVSYETIAPRAEMPNVMATFEGGLGDPDDGPHLSFNGHFDTFPVGEEDRWERDPFSGAVEDGKVHGRGAADMHAGFTASLAAFLLLFENREDVRGRVTFSATSDEESGSAWGAEYVLDEHPEYRGDAVINGEPSSNGIVRFGGRGAAWLDVETRGRSGHSAYPGNVNAIETLVGVVDDLRGAARDAVDVPEDARAAIEEGREAMDAEWGEGATDHLLDAQVNVNTIEGGGVVNVIAETASAEVDVRLPLGTSGGEVIESARAIADDHPGETSIEVTSHTDPTYSDVEHPILRYVRGSAGRVRGEEPAFSCGLAMTDARFYRLHGVPTAIYGPTPHGVGSQNEHVRVDDFMEVVRTHARAGARYMNDPEGGTDSE